MSPLSSRIAPFESTSPSPAPAPCAPVPIVVPPSPAPSPTGSHMSTAETVGVWVGAIAAGFTLMALFFGSIKALGMWLQHRDERRLEADRQAVADYMARR